MTNESPVMFVDVVEAWLRNTAPGALREKVAALHAAYDKGSTSARIDLAAYLTVRAPATFAAVQAVLRAVGEVAPELAPQSLLDVGAGPGTASFAAAGQFPGLKRATLVEADARFAGLAQELTASLPQDVSLLQQSLLSPIPAADLVIAAYVMAELPLDKMPEVARHLWRAAGSALVIVEPGTPQGFARIKALRGALLREGAEIVGPCTHHVACPMQGADWCHFKTRLARSRGHMHAKGGTVPFEDEAFAWIAVARASPSQRPDFRVLAPPAVNKIAVSLKLCGKAGLQDVAIASRDKATYKQAKKRAWGDGFTPAKPGET